MSVSIPALKHLTHLSLSGESRGGSELSQVVVEVEADGRGEEVTVHAAPVKLLVLVRHAVFTQRLAHVQGGSVMLPGVAGCMRVVAQVPLQDLSQRFLCAHLNKIRGDK